MPASLPVPKPSLGSKGRYTEFVDIHVCVDAYIHIYIHDSRYKGLALAPVFLPVPKPVGGQKGVHIDVYVYGYACFFLRDADAHSQKFIKQRFGAVTRTTAMLKLLLWGERIFVCFLYMPISVICFSLYKRL